VRAGHGAPPGAARRRSGHHRQQPGLGEDALAPSPGVDGLDKLTGVRGMGTDHVVLHEEAAVGVEHQVAHPLPVAVAPLPDQALAAGGGIGLQAVDGGQLITVVNYPPEGCARLEIRRF